MFLFYITVKTNRNKSSELNYINIFENKYSLLFDMLEYVWRWHYHQVGQLRRRHHFHIVMDKSLLDMAMMAHQYHLS